MNVISKWQELAFPILVKTMETPLYLHNLSQLQFKLKNYMRFVNSFELSSSVARPRICSSNRLGAIVSWRYKSHFEMAKKTEENCPQGMETNHFALP